MLQKDRTNLEKNVKQVNEFAEEFLKEILEEEFKKDYFSLSSSMM